MIDIVNSLREDGVKIDLYDPWINQYNINNVNWIKHVVNNPLNSDKKYDAIIVAAGHKEFKSYTDDDFKKLFNGDKIIIDVKNIVKNC